MHTTDITTLLQAIDTRYEEEAFFRRCTLDFVARYPDTCTDRNNLAGHLTASAWVLHPDRQQALLIHHRTLDKWFQPGGHIEPEDESLLAAARREVIEECGLEDFMALQPGIFDLDIHLIPAKGAMPEHPHYDVRFLFLANTIELNANLGEVKALRWASIEALLKQPIQQSIRRMALKIKM
jgi:8-oxo-dGTP pyrophosphatase MutT (NUDIX family)